VDGSAGVTSPAESRAAHFVEHFLHFWTAVGDGQPGFLIVHVRVRLKGQVWNRRSLDIHETYCRIFSEQVTPHNLHHLR
jgi:hypothetical protein